MEAKYIACSMAKTYAVLIAHFIEALKLDLLNKPINEFCNNKSAISVIKSRANSSKGKHIDVNYHYIQDIVERGEIKVDYISSQEMMADPKGVKFE